MSITKRKSIISESNVVTIDKDRIKTKLENDDPIFLEGVIQRCNVKNKNMRIYPREILEREVDRYQEFIKQGIAWGELDHPESDVVEYKNASHRIKEVSWKGDDLWGIIEVLPGQYFPSANILRGCIKIDAPIGFSSRGYGSETRISEDVYQVNDDFELLCWDSVSNPSTHGAFGMIKEGTSKEAILNRKLFAINSTIYDILS